jgi:hypothetical protein
MMRAGDGSAPAAAGSRGEFPTIKDPDHEISFELFAKGYQLLEPSIK